MTTPIQSISNGECVLDILHHWCRDICKIFLEPKMGHLTANNDSFPQQRTTRVGVVSSKIAKIYGVHEGVPLSGAPFILRGGHKYQARFCIIAFLNFKKHRYLVLFNKL